MTFEKIDASLERGDGKSAYDELKSLYDSSEDQQKNVEVLWRLAKACHQKSVNLEKKNPKKKEVLLEGRGYGASAYKVTDSNFNVLKWAAILTGSTTDYVGTKEKIEQGYVFKEYLDKALIMNPEEYSLLHMRGRYAFSVANLSWIERKAASALFATPPDATIDEALADFLAADKLRSGWIENLLYVARCYLAKDNKAEAVRFLKLAESITSVDDADREALAEVKTLLAKHAK